MTRSDPLQPFHPLIRRWFSKRFDRPTAVQGQAWPRITAGEHVLVTAPTGSGKTLTALLWALDQLAQGRWGAGAIRVLYVSPLRALNNDIRRNLTLPLAEITALFRNDGLAPPKIRVLTRSGDTPQTERRRMLRRPPEILITTPESLNILLTSVGGSRLLQGLATVILDEIHAVAGTKRGTHLITAVERLAHLSGEFQRIALSATVRPLDRIAAWVGGYEQRSARDPAELRPRPVAVIDAGQDKIYDIEIRRRRPSDPSAVSDPSDVNPIWPELAAELSGRIAQHTSSLIFANSRRVVERLARLINAREDRKLVYSHHGSLSREIREVVEERLKAGQLAGIVATSSLELGIDIGAIDAVQLIGTPPSIAAAVQRLGRSGHMVGGISRGGLYPIHPLDILAAAVVVRGVLDSAVEPLEPPEAPLDILAQIILSMTSTEAWPLDELYTFLRRAQPYHRLSRRLFDLVVEMLAGRYAGARIAALKPRLAVDRLDGTARARPGTARLLYAAGGTIPDRGYFRLRLESSRAVIGELDEEFVWERTVGQTITLGVQAWRIERISHNDVFVTPSSARTSISPFWRYERCGMSFWLAERRGRFLEEAEARLEESAWETELRQVYRLDSPAAEDLVHLLQSQRAATGCALPHRHHLVMEQVTDAHAGVARRLTILHTTWGGRVNAPLALALSAALEDHLGRAVAVEHDDDCVALELEEPLPAKALLELVATDNLERLIRSKLEQTGFFGARFRENAGRALLLPRAGFRRRTPLWLSRERAKELRAATFAYPDFPILLETWRECLRDEFDLAALASLLDEVARGGITVTEVETASPSPFAAEVIWKRTGELMYAGDGVEGIPSRLRADLIEEVVFTPRLRPRIPDPLVRQLRDKLQRIYPGYSPPDAGELVEWVKERVFLPAHEWRALLAAMERDHHLPPGELLAAIAQKVVALQTPDRPDQAIVCALEDLARVRAALGPRKDVRLTAPSLDGSAVDAAARATADRMAPVAREAAAADADTDPLSGLLADWLRYCGPVPRTAIAAALGIEDARVTEIIAELQADNRVVVGEITEHATSLEVCDPDNLGRLLRSVRTRARPVFKPLPPDALPLFLAAHQGLVAMRDGEARPAADDGAALQPIMERLFGYAAEAGLWEAEIFPARLGRYRTAWLDALLAESDLLWCGRPGQKVAFLLAAESELLADGFDPDPADVALLERTLPAGRGRFVFDDLLAQTGAPGSDELTRSLWRLTWCGLVSNETFAALRQGIAGGFKAEPATAGLSPRTRIAGRRRPFGFSRWRAARPFAGNWYRLPAALDSGDPLDREDLNRDRVRLLLDRYGVLFRELLLRELPPFQWGALFRTLRLMELSGEVVGGCFFTGVPGLQFAAPRVVRRLQQALPENEVFWLNAADPASACGLGLERLGLPRRVSTTHLVYCGRRLVLVSLRRAKSLSIRLEPHDPLLSRCFEFLQVLLTRSARPQATIVIEEINGAPAAASAYRPALEAQFDASRDLQSLRVSRRF